MGTDDTQLVLDPLSGRELEILRHIGEGLSDREIAEALFLNPNTVKWHNRQIYTKLGVGNRKHALDLAKEEGLLEAHTDAGVTAVVRPKHNLPALVTSFVGRESQVAEVQRLLESTRLLTLTGTGGVGKTRLALQVAMNSADTGAFEDGIYFVDPSPLRDAALVTSTVAGVLGVAEVPDELPVESLKRFLCDEQILLVIDNFEHLPGAAPLLSELLVAGHRRIRC